MSVLRRYTSLKSGRGTVIPPAVRAYVLARDNGCVMRHLMPDHQCSGAIELDHVRASGGIGMKSPSTAGNLVSMCGSAHRFKTENTRLMRPILVAYLERVEGPAT
jgi:hypothetical protein